MTASKSMPSAAVSPAGDADPKPLDRSELIDRLATEMRVKSGGELPLSFCIEQVKRQLAGKQAETAAANSRTVPPVPGAAKSASGSVFHAWALPD